MGPERDEWIDEDQIKAPQLIRKYNKYILRKDDPLRFQRETQSTSQKRKASETPRIPEVPNTEIQMTPYQNNIPQRAMP